MITTINLFIKLLNKEIIKNHFTFNENLFQHSFIVK